jgi:hypothetical protein
MPEAVREGKPLPFSESLLFWPNQSRKVVPPNFRDDQSSSKPCHEQGFVYRGYRKRY